MYMYMMYFQTQCQRATRGLQQVTEIHMLILMILVKGRLGAMCTRPAVARTVRGKDYTPDRFRVSASVQTAHHPGDQALWTYHCFRHTLFSRMCAYWYCNRFSRHQASIMPERPISQAPMQCMFTSSVLLSASCCGAGHSAVNSCLAAGTCGPSARSARAALVGFVALCHTAQASQHQSRVLNVSVATAAATDLSACCWYTSAKRLTS